MQTKDIFHPLRKKRKENWNEREKRRNVKKVQLICSKKIKIQFCFLICLNKRKWPILKEWRRYCRNKKQMHILIHGNYVVDTDDTALTHKQAGVLYSKRCKNAIRCTSSIKKKIPNVSLLISFHVALTKIWGSPLNVTYKSAKKNKRQKENKGVLAH